MNSNQSQYNKTQWLNNALKHLIQFGPQQLKIAKLCTAFNVTKGSFYHHFKNRDDFIHALMQYWYEETTLNFIHQANKQSGPLDKLNKLDEVIANNDIEAEIHIRAWSLTEPFISEYLEKIDARRQAYLQSCYQELELPNELAHKLATMSYAQFLGLLHLKPQPSIHQCIELSTLLAKSLLKENNRDI
jgi:AcrR family transcriptional regulator